MRPQSRSASHRRRPADDEEFFERKARELVAPDDEIEAWELDGNDLRGMRSGDYFGAPGSE